MGCIHFFMQVTCLMLISNDGNWVVGCVCVQKMLYCWTCSACPKKNSGLFLKVGGDQRKNCYCSSLAYHGGNWYAAADSVFQKMHCQNLHKDLLGSGRRWERVLEDVVQQKPAKLFTCHSNSDYVKLLGSFSTFLL